MTSARWFFSVTLSPGFTLTGDALTSLRDALAVDADDVRVTVDGREIQIELAVFAPSLLSAQDGAELAIEAALDGITDVGYPEWLALSVRRADAGVHGEVTR